MNALLEELSQSARAAWDAYRARYPDETPYAFGLYVVSEDAQIVGSAYATEEATARRADEYAFMLGSDAATRARIIRWWDADWPHCNDLRSLFDRANTLIARAPVQREVYIDALARLDRALFGDVVLGVFGGERDAIERSISRLNPPPIRDRFQAESAAAERAYSALST